MSSLTESNVQVPTHRSATLVLFVDMAFSYKHDLLLAGTSVQVPWPEGMEGTAEQAQGVEGSAGHGTQRNAVPVEAAPNSTHSCAEKGTTVHDVTV